ncbi:MAG: hypothetical protein QW478_12995 [Candidatus Micrarchaeaceae archaeon]
MVGRKTIIGGSLLAFVFSMLLLASSVSAQSDLCNNALPGTIGCSTTFGQLGNSVNINAGVAAFGMSNAGAIISVAFVGLFFLVIVLKLLQYLGIFGK